MLSTDDFCTRHIAKHDMHTHQIINTVVFNVNIDIYNIVYAQMYNGCILYSICIM